VCCSTPPCPQTHCRIVYLLLLHALKSSNLLRTSTDAAGTATALKPHLPSNPDNLRCNTMQPHSLQHRLSHARVDNHTLTLFLFAVTQALLQHPTWPTNALPEGVSDAVTCPLINQSAPHFSKSSSICHCPEATRAGLYSIAASAKLERDQPSGSGHFR
jgi:hypothetical protein